MLRGTRRFSESSQRRFHKLVQIPGDLRQFSITAELAPRDNRIPPEQVMLAPGEAFSWQLMFVKQLNDNTRVYRCGCSNTVRV